METFSWLSIKRFVFLMSVTIDSCVSEPTYTNTNFSGQLVHPHKVLKSYYYQLNDNELKMTKLKRKQFFCFLSTRVWKLKEIYR